MNKGIESKKEELMICEEKLSQITNEVENRNIEIQLLKCKIQGKEIKPQKKKKLVQTSFFKPVVKKEIVGDDEVKQLIKTILEIDIESTTPVDALKKLLEFKEKLKKFSS